VTGCPEWSPTPAQLTAFANVCWARTQSPQWITQRVPATRVPSSETA